MNTSSTEECSWWWTNTSEMYLAVEE